MYSDDGDGNPAANAGTFTDGVSYVQQNTKHRYWIFFTEELLDSFTLVIDNNGQITADVYVLVQDPTKVVVGGVGAKVGPVGVVGVGGYVEYGGGTFTKTALIQTPEPSIVVLFSIGATSLLAYYWRKRRTA